LGGIIATRILHNPLRSFKYKKRSTVPEIGICLEILNHMAINRFGKVSVCVRFDPRGLGVIGDANSTALTDIWHGSKRKEWIQYHIGGIGIKFLYAVIVIFGEYRQACREREDRRKAC